MASDPPLTPVSLSPDQDDLVNLRPFNSGLVEKWGQTTRL